MTVEPTDALLEIDHLRVTFRNGRHVSHAVHDVSLSVRPGEVVGLVGESGSGKSLTCRAVTRLFAKNGGIPSGSVRFAGQDMLAMSAADLRRVRAREIGMIFQDPFTSLNPTLRVGAQIVETLRLNLGMDRTEAGRRAAELLGQVEIPDPVARLGSYPHELSGGMRQRVMIALAIASNPRLLIADEPTTALDVSTQAQVLALLVRIRAERNMAMLIVSHDFGVIAAVCDRVVVMYGGYVVEAGPLNEVYRAPTHPYTRALLDAVPGLEVPPQGYRRPAIPGPPLGTTPYVGGCPFAPRCVVARPECTTIDMHLAEVDPGHVTACPFEAVRAVPVEVGR